MHIVLGLLTTIVSILYLLDRMGIDLGGLNPFYWRRRRAWAQKYQGDPVYSVEEPLHVAALLIVGVGKLDGDLSAEQKRVVLARFQEKFSLDPKAASELLGSAAHLLGAPQIVDTQLNGVLQKNKDRFSGEQAESLLQMMADVAAAEGQPSARQNEFIEQVRSLLVAPQAAPGVWT